MRSHILTTGHVATAVSTEAIGLFGGSPPLTYSPRIHVLEPEDPGSGMAGISVDLVVRAIGRYGLTRDKSTE